MANRRRVKTETATAGSLTKLFHVVARMLAEHRWRVVAPPTPRETEHDGTVWDVRLERYIDD